MDPEENCCILPQNSCCRLRITVLMPDLKECVLQKMALMNAIT